MAVSSSYKRQREETILFNVSKEENYRLNTLVKLSGLKKQDYIVKRIENTDINIFPSPRVCKALKNVLQEMAQKLQNNLSNSELPNDELLEIIMVTAGMMDDMKG